MKKILLLLFILLNALSSFCQDDSSFEYFNKKGKKVNRDKAFYLEKTKKVGDSLWEIKRFRKSGKLLGVRFSKTKNKKHLIGQSITYNFNDDIASMMFFNKKGESHGRYLTWFPDRSKSIEGITQNNKREGIWKYYHYNGNIAERIIYKNDSVIRGEYFDEQGKKIFHNLDFCKKKPYFTGGHRKFVEKLESLSFKVKSLKGKKINVNFVIDINGNITNVHVDEFLPIKTTQKIVDHFKKIKGWNPGISNHRRVSSVYHIPLNFK